MFYVFVIVIKSHEKTVRQSFSQYYLTLPAAACQTQAYFFLFTNISFNFITAQFL